MGAVHLALSKMAADTGDPFFLVEGADLQLCGADVQRAVALQALLFRRTACRLLEALAGEGPGMGGALPFMILRHMTGPALARVRSFNTLRRDSGKVAERGTASQEKHSGEENGSCNVG